MLLGQAQTALSTVKIKKVKVVLSLSGYKLGQSIEAYLWPRVTFEFQGKEKTVAFTNWPNRNAQSKSQASAPSGRSIMSDADRFRNTVARMAGVKINILKGTSLRNAVLSSSHKLEETVMRRITAASRDPSFVSRFKKVETKARKAIAMEDLKKTMVKWEKLLEKRDVLHAWNLAITHSVMES